MIKADKLIKRFDKFEALSSLTCSIPESSIYGLVGSNGAGKSTFLRLLAGVYKPDGGTVTIDGEKIYGNTKVLSDIIYVPDELYFLPGSNIKRMGELYRNTRGYINDEKLKTLAESIGLDMNRPIAQFSKGMKRQAATILALACEPKIILFDETFDGLDPVMRNTVKRIIVDDVLERKATVIITSHSLRELEDTCDQLALLHKGGLVLESDVQNLKTSLFKVQIALDRDFSKEQFEDMAKCEVINFVKHGSVAKVIVKGDREEVENNLHSVMPLLLDILPLSLEEVFIYEMEALGYCFDDIAGGENNEK